MDKTQQMSALGRPLDPSYFTNRLILMLTPILGIIAGGFTLFQTGELNEALIAGFWMGTAIFLTWVIAREIDPDHDYSAFLAVAFAFIGMIFFSVPSLDIIGLVGIMMATRIVNRMVGMPCTIGDTIALTVLAVIVLFFAIASELILVLALAFILDGILDQPLRRHLYLGSAVLLIGIVAIAIMKTDFDIIIPDAPTVLWASFGVIYAMSIAHTRTVQCQCDNGNPVSVDRIRATMLLPLVAGTLILLTAPDTLPLLLPVWTAMLAVPVYRLGVIIGIVH